MAERPQEPQWPTYRADEESSVPDSPRSGLPAVPPGTPPAVAQSSFPVPAATDPNLVPRRPGYSPLDPLVLAAGGGTLRKEGVWTVPPYLRVQGDLGSIRLDFRQAQLSAQVIWMDITGGVGTITMIVPEGWAAQTERLRPGWGSRKVRIVEEPVPGNPVLVLTGSLGMGTLVVRYPTRGDGRRLERRLRREQRRRGQRQR